MMRVYRFKKLMRQTDKAIAPNKEWQAVLRSQVLHSVSRAVNHQSAQLNNQEQENPFSIGFIRFFTQLLTFKTIAFRPVLAVFLLIAIVSYGTGATVSAALSSLPGDAFYPIKIGLEKAQITLAPSKEKKAELAIAFAGSRLSEVKEIIKNRATSGQSKAQTAAHIEQAINNFNNNLQGVQNQLEELKKDTNNSETVVGISKLVNDQTTALQSNLAQIQDKISAATDQAAAAASAPISADLATAPSSLNKAQELVDQASDASLAVIVSNAASSGNNNLKEEAKVLLKTSVEKMEKKIEATQSLMSSTSPVVVGEAMKEAMKKPEEAKKSINEAKKMLDQNGFSGGADQLNEVLSKVQESKSMVKEYDRTLQEVKDLVK